MRYIIEQEPITGQVSNDKFTLEVSSAGSPGLSAYQQWLVEGNTGTWADFYESLRGPTGFVDPSLQALHDETIIAKDNAVASALAADADAAQTAADRVQTGLDRTATGADRVQTGQDVTTTAAARDKAAQWADNNEDIAVEAGKYSAKHWAAKSEASAVSSGVPNHEAAYNHPGYDAHVVSTENPHTVTKDQVGLGNADNTSDMDKPVSTAQQAAIDTRVSNDDDRMQLIYAAL